MISNRERSQKCHKFEFFYICLQLKHFPKGIEQKLFQGEIKSNFPINSRVRKFIYHSSL